MIHIKPSALAIAAALCWAAGAQAGPITVQDVGIGTEAAYPEFQNQGKPGYAPANGNTNPNSPDGYHNGSVYLTPGTYHLEYWGSGNSSFDNAFTLNASANYTFTGGPIVSLGPGGNGGVSGGYSLTVTTATFLDFIYSTNNGTATTTDDCSIQSGTAAIGICNYLAGVDGATVSTNDPDGAGPLLASTNGSIGYLGFSDRSEGVDVDHQDLTVLISSVPEPTSLALVGAALAGLGFARRRKTA